MSGAVVRAKSGTEITIGSFAGGYPVQTTSGSRIEVVDAGIPLMDYSPQETDPLTIWKRQPSVRKVVEFAARQVASLPWHAFDRVSDTDRQRLRDSRLEEVLRAPAPHVTGFNFWNRMVTDRMLYDVALAVYADGQLTRIPPALIRIASDPLGGPRQIVVATGEGAVGDIDVTGAPKIFAYGWHATKAGGVSPMQTLAAILEENLRSVEWRSQQWENSPKISGVIKRPADAKRWHPEQRERFTEQWRSWRDGAAAGGTPILDDGMEYDPLMGLSPKDANDIEGRQLTDAEVASAFHIPPELVGARAGNFASIDAFRQMLFGPTLGPMLTELEQAVNAGGLVRELGGSEHAYAEINREAGIAGSFLEQARILQTLTGRPLMTAAEGRARLNLPHIADTDDLIVPLNVTVGGLASPTATGDQNAGLTNQERAEGAAGPGGPEGLQE